MSYNIYLLMILLLFVYYCYFFSSVIVDGFVYPSFVIVIAFGFYNNLVIWVLRKDDVMQELSLQSETFGGALSYIHEL